MFGEKVYANKLYSREENIKQDFPSGIYIVKVSDTDKQFVEKLIVQ